MTTLPIEDDLNDPETTELKFQDAIGLLHNYVSHLPAGPAKTYTISSNNIQPDNAIIVVDTEGGEAGDDLSTIDPTILGEKIIFVSCVTSARVVTVKHLAGGSGQIQLSTGNDFVLSTDTEVLSLRYHAATDRWIEVFNNKVV